MAQPRVNQVNLHQLRPVDYSGLINTLGGIKDRYVKEQQIGRDRQDRLLQQDIENKRAQEGLLLQQAAGKRADESLQMQKHEAARQVGKDNRAQVSEEQTNIAMADPEGYLAKLKAVREADAAYAAKLNSYDLDTPEGEAAFLAEPEVNSDELLNKMSKVKMGEVQKFLLDKAESEATRKYQQGILANSRASLSLQQKKFEDEIAQREHNAQALRDLYGIPMSQTKAEAAGVPKDFYLKQFESTVANMRPEVRAKVAPTQLAAMLQQAKQKDAANQEVVPVDIGKAAQKVLMGSKADVATYGKIADIIQKGKPVADEGDKLLAKVGLTKGSDEADKFLEQYRKKLTYTNYNKGSRKDGEIDYLLKSLEPLTTNDDPVESNRKLIEMYPDLLEYAEKNNITFNEAVDLLRIETARNQGMFSLWDQDVERGGEALLDKNY